MNYKLNSEKLLGPSVSIPLDVLDNVLNLGSLASILILIYIFKNVKKEYDPIIISNDINLNKDDVIDALEVLKKTGLLLSLEENKVKEDKKSAKVPTKSRVLSNVNRPHFKRTDVIAMLNNNKELGELVSISEHLFGKAFTNADLDSLAALYDFYGLTTHYILSAIEYCSSIGKKGMAYVESICIDWINNAINDENLDEHIDVLRRQNKYEETIKKEFGIYNRVFSTKEKEFVRNWFETFHTPLPLIKLAYDKSIDSTGKISFSYVNTILTKWFKNRIVTLEDAAKDIESKKSSKKLSREDRNREYEKLAEEYN